MAATTPEKYAARLTELEALHHELESGKRPGDGAVVVGLLLEAAGDVLRRRAALNAKSANLNKPLGAIPELALRSWGDGVQVEELAAKLKRAASQAVESALPDSVEDGDAMDLIDEFSECGIAVVVITGYSGFVHARIPVIYKPFDTNKLLETVSASLKQTELQQSDSTHGDENDNNHKDQAQAARRTISP